MSAREREQGGSVISDADPESWDCPWCYQIAGPGDPLRRPVRGLLHAGCALDAYKEATGRRVIPRRQRPPRPYRPRSR